MGRSLIILTVLLTAAASRGADNKVILDGTDSTPLPKGWIVQGHASGNRAQRLFDEDWRFIREAIQGAEDPAFDDAGWRTLNLPHDWSIEGPWRGKDACDWRGGYVPLGAGWYRKTFRVPTAFKGRQVAVEFGGVYKNSDVWINGHHLGNQWYGYSSFQYDLTPHINWGGRNVMAVRVLNEKQTCRWYTGSGIYRHVWLNVTDKLSVDHWGTHVTTPWVSEDAATVCVATEIRNRYAGKRTCVLQTQILDVDGNKVAGGETRGDIAAGGIRSFQQSCTVTNADLWSAVNPVIYTARTTLSSGGRVVDSYDTPFGIRTVAWDPQRGFVINGKAEKLKGVNIHHDLGCLGAAFHERVAERRLEVLKEMGCNAIRMAHNPPARELLHLCDRMGFYVIDEAFDKWTTDRYRTLDADWPKDLRAMIRRDRNHPSIVLWSLGNENWAPKFGRRKELYQAMVAEAKKHDASRDFTYALSPGKFMADAQLMDVVSLNYMEHMLDTYRRAAPGKVMIVSEAYPYWGKDKDGDNHPWLAAARNAAVAGSFVWTGISYLGEAKARWPFRGWNCSLIDTCGFRRPVSYRHESFWSEKPMVCVVVLSESLDTQRPVVAQWGWPKMVSHWTLPGSEGKKVRVAAFTNCDAVELVVNGTSQGRKKPVDAEDGMIAWDDVAYRPGIVIAKGFREGVQVCAHELATAGEAARIQLDSDRKAIAADGRDVCHVVATVVDRRGNRVPSANHRVRFAVEGGGRILGIDNGDLTAEWPYQGSETSMHNGRCLVLLQSDESGPTTLTAKAAGLESATVAVLGK